ncbi:MAG: multicopper oxidase domain-containing protein [Gammaproteobacteria bacterium]
MMGNTPPPPNSMAWRSMIFTALRIALGLLWGLVAIRFWSADFSAHLRLFHETALSSQPGLLIVWFAIWAGIVSTAADFFAQFGRICATVMAVCLLAGFARRMIYILGIILCIPFWTLAEGYLLPQSLSTFGLGAVLIYILLFAVLLYADRLRIPQLRSVDDLMLQKWPGWRWICGFSRQDEEAYAPGQRQAFTHGAFTVLLGAVFAVLISGAGSSLNLGHPVSPDPLQMGGHKPVAAARSAALPPLAGTDDTVEIHIEASTNTVEIASGVSFRAMTFDGSVPAPILHVRQGQTVKIRFTNNDPMMPHSIDFHSAKIAPNRAFASATFGQTVEFSFKAEVPGAFLYHCSTVPVVLHLASGMYGAIVIDPIEPLPKADVEYVLVQSEWYTQRFTGNTMMGDYQKIMADQADLVAFNGVAFQYNDHPLPAKVGERVRIHFINAGPNRWSSFHVIGGIFDTVYPDGDFSNVRNNVSSYSVGPGQGNIFDITFTEPGKYPFMDHSMKNMTLGAAGLFDVR